MPKKGDIVFYKATNNFIDRAIEFFSRAKHEIVHVAIWIADDTTIEANMSRTVGYSTISGYSNEHIIKTCPRLTDAQRNAIISYLHRQFGEPYDYLEIGKLALHYFGLTIPYRETKRKICSTLVNDAYLSVGIDLTGKGLDVTPEDLFNSPLLVEVN